MKPSKSGGNAGVYRNLTKKGVSPSKARETAAKFRKNANRKKGG